MERRRGLGEEVRVRGEEVGRREREVEKREGGGVREEGSRGCRKEERRRGEGGLGRE